jgi:hypothetical protein
MAMKLFLILAAALLIAAAAASAETVRTELSGYEETPLTLDTAGSGKFTAKIRNGGTVIDYVLSYKNTESPVTQAHIHFGRPAITGGIVLFLCTNLTPPAGVPLPQLCPAAPATITGSLTAADVIAVPGQGIAAGAVGFAEMVRAIRTGAAYANVHTTGRPTGEIRGQLDDHGHHDD